MTFALRPLQLHTPRPRPVEPDPAATVAHDTVPPAARPLVPEPGLDEIARPVPASFRDLTIPDVVPLPQHSWRRPRAVRGRAS